jgi:hypothetical protein
MLFKKKKQTPIIIQPETQEITIKSAKNKLANTIIDTEQVIIQNTEVWYKAQLLELLREIKERLNENPRK